MKNIDLFIKSINGRGWLIPVRDILINGEFKNHILELSDANIFNLGDVFILKGKNQLSERLASLNLNSNEKKELENLLLLNIEKVILYEGFKKKITKYFLYFAVFFVLFQIGYNKYSSDIKKKNNEIMLIEKSIDEKNKEISEVDRQIGIISEAVETCTNQ